MLRIGGLWAVIAVAVTAGAGVRAADVSCEGVQGFDALDFWLGEWTVLVDGRQVGSNRISKILEGCAVVEEWTDSRGGEGRSLFYYIPAREEWKQVWVTPNATRPGGVKEKTLVERRDDGAVRFLGEIPLPDGGSYLDRTTLTPLEDGRVRQVIETSRDGGESWQTGFDAVYEPRQRRP